MSDETGLIQQQPRNALVDLRSQAMGAMSVEAIRAGLSEYQERRNTFRAWLLSQMEEGVHYGFPPGCRSEDKGKAWRSKPSLYKAGAEKVSEVLGIRAEYASDEVTWRMAGEPKDTFFRICTLYSIATGAVVGHGTGARKNGAKGMDVNASLKMADKSALVAAIISTYSLSDLFTQDIEDLQAEPHQNPEPKQDAPKASPRKDRVAPDETADPAELKVALNEWKDHRDALGQPNDKEALERWINAVLPAVMNRNGSVLNPLTWRKSEVAKIHELLKKERGGN